MGTLSHIIDDGLVFNFDASASVESDEWWDLQRISLSLKRWMIAGSQFARDL